MRVHYRYVPYGTNFEPHSGPRPPGARGHAALYENEIAADVGSLFWNSSPATARPIPVIDHHFNRDGQFPSASAAVLHSAPMVHQWWQQCSKSFDEVWLVSHESPDFDAFASLYLIRSLKDWNSLDALALGIAPDSWRNLTEDECPPRGRRRFHWFAPPFMPVENEVLWRLLLAGVASMSDSCRRFGCHKTQASPSILYAALQRGRPFLESGAAPLFDHFRKAVTSGRLNPFTDAIFEADPEFAPEVAMLAREGPAYDRDVRRARRAMVAVPCYQGSFDPFYAARKDQPFHAADGNLNPVHLAFDAPPASADAIYIRDPESLLFKDLARMDTENSSLGSGFLFTAVAYSNGRPEADGNRTEYYFALDPERAGHRTLYPLWAQLQDGELRRLSPQDRQTLGSLQPRGEFRDRAAGLGGLFHDPWFDAANYRTTMAATPHRGTAIGPPGVAPDLSDDPVARIVRHHLEYSVYREPARVLEFPAGGPPLETIQSMQDALAPAPSREAVAGFRFCSVCLDDAVEAGPPLQARQTGEQLWSLLHPGSVGLPADFSERHFTQDRDGVAVWSRRGLAVAYRTAAAPRLQRTEAQFRRLILLLAQVPGSVGSASGVEDEVGLERSGRLLREIALLRQELGLPDSLLAFRRFVDAIGFHETLANVRDLLSSRVARAGMLDGQNIAKSTSLSIEAVEEGQKNIELLEILIVTLYSVEMLHIVMGLLGDSKFVEVRIVCALGGLIALVVWIGMAFAKAKRPKQTRRWHPWDLIPVLTLLFLAVGFAATFQPWTAMYEKLVGKEQVPPTTLQAPPDPVKQK